MPPTVSYRTLLSAALAASCLLLTALVETAHAQAGPSSGGATFVPPPPPPEQATIVGGRVIAPASAPMRVKRVIDAANRIVNKPYVYGGGHRPFTSRLDRGYDCSGSVSFALFGGRFLRSPLPSGALMNWA
jgi:cell wall-associated NlpC family hydrolase